MVTEQMKKHLSCNIYFTKDVMNMYASLTLHMSVPPMIMNEPFENRIVVGEPDFFCFQFGLMNNAGRKILVAAVLLLFVYGLHL